MALIVEIPFYGEINEYSGLKSLKFSPLKELLREYMFLVETLCQGQKNSEGNFCFPRHDVFQPKGYIFLGFHPLTYHKPLHFNGFCFILSLQILHNLLDDRLPPWGTLC